MQMSDSREVDAPREVVWAAILNPEVLKECVPGCTEMTGTPEDGFQATVVQKVGPVKATFKGNVVVSERDEPNSLKLSGEGKGGAAGFAKGGATVRLEENGAGTLLHYDVEANVGGKLAQLGSRIIDGFAKKMADQFFTRLQEAIEGPQDPEEAAETEATPGDKKKGWFKRLVT
ncbi:MULTISPECIES: CoxG family protein [unclassified Roseivivax]|uniref:CoxG family protein n=1 Tax=Roseivivax sp. GX 12232 TaxID=2900547 RepID=UPI001E2F7CE8|nr:carbon monoxide dehydrogenase subunit G [Roseivivax sp. GX 12232]MCE0504903.1 carbon monoxide dehydrogenase subunit G [Roseivivax sp. GX 12232]